MTAPPTVLGGDPAVIVRASDVLLPARRHELVLEEEPGLLRTDDAAGPGGKYGCLVDAGRALVRTGRRFGAGRTDVLLAAALLAVGTLEASVSVGAGGLAALAPVPALTLPLAYRRRGPAAVALVVTAAVVGPVILGSALLLERTFTGFVCLLVACYGLGRHEERRVSALATIGCAGALAVTIGVNDASVASGALAAMIVAAAAAGGRIVRDRTGLVEVLERQARELDAASGLQAEISAARERDRLSRELADMVSTGVTEMVAQVQAVRHAPPPDPAATITSIGAVETTGKQALADMRRLLGSLRGDEEVALGPQPTLTRLDALVERSSRHGRAAQLTVEGEPAELPPGVDAAAYRIVEEVLAAAERQGAAPVQVHIRHTRHALEVELSTDVPLSLDLPPESSIDGPADGSGGAAPAVGLRERVAAFEGDLWTGRTGDGWVVRARLPVGARPGRPASTGRPAGPNRARAARDRSRSWSAHPPVRPVRLRISGLVVLALSVAAVVEAAATPAREGPSWANVLAASAVAAPLLLGRSRPVLAAVLAWTAATVMGATLTPVADVPSLLVVLLLYPYLCARYADRRRARAGLAVSLGGLLTLDIAQGTMAWGDIVFPVLLLALSWAVGRMAGSRALMARDVAERAQQLEQVRDEQSAAAASSERRRMARELHDVVAHTLSVMVIHAGAARWTFERDARRANDALQIVEETGRAALVELRRLLGLLDPLEATEAVTAQPGLGQLRELVHRTWRAGVPVELRVEGEARPLPAELDLAAYRIAQEALTNALRHAGDARVQLTIRYADDAVHVEVVDDGHARPTKGRGDQPGHGLAGMRERVSNHGGELFAGPLAGRGFAVRARLPARDGWGPPQQAPVVEDAGAESPLGDVV